MLTSILQCGELESLSLEKFELLLTAHQDYIVSRLTDHFDPVLQELREVAHASLGVDVHPEQRDVNTQEPMKEVKKEVLFVPRASRVPSETMKVWPQKGSERTARNPGRSPHFDIRDDYSDAGAIQDSVGFSSVNSILSPSFDQSAHASHILPQIPTHSQTFSSKRRGVSETQSQPRGSVVSVPGRSTGVTSHRSMQGFASSAAVSIARTSMSSIDSAECCDEGLPMTLPPNWPTVPQRSGLQDSGWSMKSLTYSLRRKNRIGTDRDAALFGVLHQRRRSPLMLHPDSWFCTALEGVAVVVLVAELCLLPFTLAFDVPTKGSVLAVVWTMVCFWTLDFLLSINTGVWTGDGLELRRSFVQRHRFRGWASFDLCLLALDWTSLFLTESESTSSGRVLRMAKVSKLLRATMLLRMVRLAQILEKWLDRFGFGDMTALLKITGLSLSALWLSHVFACIWYAVGKAREESWLDMFFSDDTRYSELGTVSIYCTSFHWAITQMTLGSVDVYAINSQERLLSICVMIFGLLFTSTLVSSVSASLVGSQMLAGHRAQQAHNLEVYLRQNKVTPLLASHVLKIANATLRRSDKLLESDVEALNLLPKSLKQQLRYAVFKPTLDRHRFFSTIETLHASTTRELCDEAMEFILLRVGEDLFVPGGEGDASFCTMEGDMVYLQDPNTSPAMGFMRDLVKVGSWMCEAALWVHWTHVGRATSVHPCKILVVHAEPLIRNLKKHRLVQQFSRGYSNQFYKCVCASRPPLNKWPTDLFVANTDFSDMVVALPQDIRTAIGLHVLENRGEGDNLQKEILQGTSSLVPTENGGAQRVVLVAVFHIQREDGRVLVQLGFRESQGMVPLCVLPGAKYRPDDGVDVAAQRVLRTKLGFLHGDVDVYQSRKKSDEYTSRRHGVHTKYVRTIFFARMRFPGTPLWRIAHRAHSSFFSNVSQVFYGSRPRSYDVHQWDVFAHEDPMRTTVYGWLTPDEFKLFEEGTLQSDHILSNLMSSLIEPAPVECLELQDGCVSVPESMLGAEETGEDDVCDDDGSD